MTQAGCPDPRNPAIFQSSTTGSCPTGQTLKAYSGARPKWSIKYCAGRTGNDRIGGGVDQRCGLLGEMLIGRLKTTWDNYEIAPLDKAVLAQFIKESGNGWRLTRRRHQKAETIDAVAFLRPCYERPSGRRTSNYLDEVASSHLPPQGYNCAHLECGITAGFSDRRNGVQRSVAKQQP